MPYPSNIEVETSLNDNNSWKIFLALLHIISLHDTQYTYYAAA